MASIDKLLELINAQNSLTIPLTKQNVQVTEVVADAGPQWNTRVTLQAVAGQGYAGEVSVFYNRADMAEILDDSGLISATAFTPEMIVQKINDNWATWLTVDDLVTFTIPDLSDGEIHDVILTARADSLGWYGSVRISLVQADVVSSLHTLLHVTMPAPGYL